MKIILASQSPRRVFLLQQMGLEFDQIPSDFEEYFDETKTSAQVAEELALGKASTVATNYPDSLIIGSDCIVELDGEQLGKPETKQEAFDRLKSYANKDHYVISSIAVVCKSTNYHKTGHEVTTVRFSEMSDEEIWEYIETGDPMDKAGSYALQHPLIQPHIIKIEGRLDNQMGLSTKLLSQFLEDFDIHVNPLDISMKEFIQDKFQV